MRRDLRHLITERLSHVLWPHDAGDHDTVRCSCGFLCREAVDWDDDYAMVDIRESEHVGDYIAAYPDGPLEQTLGGVVIVSRHKIVHQLTTPDLVWLLEQPDLPEEFRRAAAVHLQP